MDFKAQLYEKAVNGEKLANFIESLLEYGVLDQFLPEVAILVEMPHDFATHPESPTVFGHVMNGLRKSRSDNSIINIAFLFHDVGKGVTHGTKQNPDGTLKNTYIGHDVKGIDLINDICKRLDISEEHARTFKFVAYRHMLLHAKKAKDLKNKTIVELVSSPHWEILKECSYMDEIARNELANTDEFNNGVERMQRVAMEVKATDGSGAFKFYPVELQPMRIPVDKYDEVVEIIRNKVSNIGKIFMPSIKKALNKVDTGDLDVIIDPVNRLTWRDDILKALGDNVINKESNGLNFMLVVKNIFGDGNQYMIDFILCEEGRFEYRVEYAKFGTIIPAVLGSFARSLRYKYDQNGFYIRYQNSKGNFRNILLTDSHRKAMEIMMLDNSAVENDGLYSPADVANWITSSPRFDSELWHTPPRADGQTIVTKNLKSHRAAKIKPEVQEAYNLVDAIIKKATWDNTGYKIERKILGDEAIDAIAIEADKYLDGPESLPKPSVTGNDVMRITGLKPGPKIGEIIKHIVDNALSYDQAIQYLEGLNDKQTI